MVLESNSEIPGRSDGSAARPPRTETLEDGDENPGWETSHTVRPLSSLAIFTEGASSGFSGPYGGRSFGNGVCCFCAKAHDANNITMPTSFRNLTVRLRAYPRRDWRAQELD